MKVSPLGYGNRVACNMFKYGLIILLVLDYMISSY